jgi:hypothetical protein
MMSKTITTTTTTTTTTMLNLSGKRSAPIALQIPDYVRDMVFAEVDARFVAVMDTAQTDRGMIASEFHTRCVQRSEVHELICLQHNDDGLVDLNDAWYLGFIAFSQSCVLAKGMRFECRGRTLGMLAAFDTTHTPNHLNILLCTPSPKTGKGLGIRVGDRCGVCPAGDGHG